MAALNKEVGGPRDDALPSPGQFSQVACLHSTFCSVQLGGPPPEHADRPTMLRTWNRGTEQSSHVAAQPFPRYLTYHTPTGRCQTPKGRHNLGTTARLEFSISSNTSQKACKGNQNRPPTTLDINSPPGSPPVVNDSRDPESVIK